MTLHVDNTGIEEVYIDGVRQLSVYADGVRVFHKFDGIFTGNSLTYFDAGFKTSGHNIMVTNGGTYVDSGAVVLNDMGEFSGYCETNLYDRFKRMFEGNSNGIRAGSFNKDYDPVNIKWSPYVKMDPLLGFPVTTVLTPELGGSATTSQIGFQTDKFRIRWMQYFEHAPKYWGDWVTVR